MCRFLGAFILTLLITTPLQAQDNAHPAWRPVQAETLLTWIKRAPEEAIIIPPEIAMGLRLAIDSGDTKRLNRAADAGALRLLRAYHGKCCGSSLRSNWHITPTISDAALRKEIADGLIADKVDLMLRANRPDHPHYRVLTTAYMSTDDAALRALLARNLARWRSLPLPERGRYLIVNAASQTLTLWEDDRPIGSWRVIVGKKGSPTPVFTAQVSGVVLNPWWEIPSSIAAEGIGAFVRRNPSAARAKGYIYSNGRYRQMPGDNNALGRMKLVMPNRFTVFLHDTSNRELFQLDGRTLSHGCVRVDRALEFAGVLLNDADWTPTMVDEAVASNVTQTVTLPKPIPLFVAYFTAEPNGKGGVRELADIYRRDR
ncbi:L,D-transpeptidase family protein [Altererythrobacter sp. ZODW24]|uniref:L,D-transpeptidase family protein n=1 Tax=Altererythrobacter sp. ZODW24 TaxID=2185142 RepID=UPI0013B3E55B|nr:L,D-transpeptidase family protein [Altererythrobacter sp. ZODW24]